MKVRRPAGRKPKILASVPMRHSLDLLFADFERILGDPLAPERRWHLSEALRNLAKFHDLFLTDPVSALKFVEIIRLVRSATGTGRDMTERRLMEDLAELSRRCRGEIGNDVVEPPPAGTKPSNPISAESQPFVDVMRVFCQYALDCLDYNRPHDSASGRRRADAFEVLAQAGSLVCLSEVVLLARESLRKVNSPAVYGAMEFLKEYFLRKGEVPDPAIVEELLSLSARTGKRAIASSALSVLIANGVISELQALDRMDEWKERRWGRSEIVAFPKILHQQ